MDASPFSLPPAPGLPSPTTGDDAVYRYLAERVRASLRVVPCQPDTDEARAERDAAVIAIAASFNPATLGEALCATRAAIADAHQSWVEAELIGYRGDPLWTGRLLRQSASCGREARGALNALMKLQQQRCRLSDDARRAADAAGDALRDGLTEALRTLPPPLPELARAPAASPAAPPPPPPKITRPPAPLPPSLLHLADRPDLPELAEEGPNAPPGYLPWEPGCSTPMWYTTTDDNLTDEQRALRYIWLDANEFCITRPLAAQAIRKHGGPPPDGDVELPSADVMHVLLHDNSSNMVWADTWKPHQAKPKPEAAAEAAAASGVADGGVDGGMERAEAEGAAA